MKVFPEAYEYDEPLKIGTREEANACDVALVAVPTDLKDGELDMSIVEDVVGWLMTPLIIIKSALMPGTTDRLVKKYNKRIAVSLEYVGEGNYPVPFWKYPHQSDPRYHQMLIIGGEDDVAEKAAQVLWERLSPDIKIHKCTALEVEITKFIENAYGALKVTFANTFLSLAEKSGTSFVRMHQAWQADPRTDSMHLRAVSHNKGWGSKCWDKDVPALVTYAKSIGANDTAKLFQTVLDLNEEHLK